MAGGRDEWITDELLGPVFETKPDGSPMFSLVYLELSRGSWKTGGAAAVALTEAVLEPGTDVVIAAGDLDQAKIALEQVDGYLARSDRLSALFTSRGDERHCDGGSRVRVISSDAPTAWGLGGTHRRFRVICDELTVWAREALWEALVSATGKVSDAQTIVLSNAGFDAGRSWQWRVREAARTQPWGYLFTADGPVASWVTAAWVEQQRALLPLVAFERVILNRWSTGSGDFVAAEQWRRCVDERLSPKTRGTGGRYFAGLDLGLTKDRTALAIVHRDGDVTQLDELTVWEGSREDAVSIVGIERAVVDASERFPGLQASADPWQLKGSIERLDGRVRIAEFVFSAGSVQKLSATLHGAITSGALRVYPDAELEREILGLRVVETTSGWRFDHRAGGYSDRAVALAMALLLSRERGTSSGRMRVSRPRGSVDGRGGGIAQVAERIGATVSNVQRTKSGGWE
jgi:hypothetical protein